MAFDKSTARPYWRPTHPIITQGLSARWLHSCSSSKALCRFWFVVVLCDGAICCLCGCMEARLSTLAFGGWKQKTSYQFLRRRNNKWNVLKCPPRKKKTTTDTATIDTATIDTTTIDTTIQLIRLHRRYNYHEYNYIINTPIPLIQLYRWYNYTVNTATIDTNNICTNTIYTTMTDNNTNTNTSYNTTTVMLISQTTPPLIPQPRLHLPLLLLVTLLMLPLLMLPY